MRELVDVKIVFLVGEKGAEAEFSELEVWWRPAGRVERRGIFIILEFERDEYRKRYFRIEVGFVERVERQVRKHGRQQ